MITDLVDLAQNREGQKCSLRDGHFEAKTKRVHKTRAIINNTLG